MTPSIKTLADAAKRISQLLEWDREVLEDFHAYAQRFDCAAGFNVYRFVLQDALRYRGMTLVQLRRQSEK